jgi:hypothetical protein
LHGNVSGRCRIAPDLADAARITGNRAVIIADMVLKPTLNDIAIPGGMRWS